MAVRRMPGCLAVVLLGGCGLVFGASDEFMLDKVAGLADGRVFYAGSSYQSPDQLGVRTPDGKDVRFSDSLPGCGQYSVNDLVAVGNGAKVLLGCDLAQSLVIGDLAVDGRFDIVAQVPHFDGEGPKLKLSASGDVYFSEHGCGAVARITVGGAHEILMTSSTGDRMKWTPKPSEASCGSPVLGWLPVPVRGSDFVAFAYADSIVVVDTASGETVARMPEFVTTDVLDIDTVPLSAEHAVVVSGTTSGKRGLYLLSPEDGRVRLVILGNFGNVAVTENGKEVLAACGWCDNGFTRVAL